MSEFTENYKIRINLLTGYIKGLINNEKGSVLLKKYNILETVFLPRDILNALDNIMKENFDMEQLKVVSNKLFNILYKMLTEYPAIPVEKGSVIDILKKDNAGVKELLLSSRPLLQEINKNNSLKLRQQLKEVFQKIEAFKAHYIIMQNVVFPEIEQYIEHHQCLKLMWSFHDDIVANIQKTIALLEAETFDLKEFNRVSSKVYFNLNTIIFREENVLFPVMIEVFPAKSFDKMIEQLYEIPPAFTSLPARRKKAEAHQFSGSVKLSTGELSLKQLELIFKHLPVDMTYVDENDEVRFYSDPRHRIFPRSIGVVGRKVQNCHPHESVDVVERIITSFRNGEKDEASFWIKMGHRLVLIRYFAVRDEEKNYKGVLEVSQEISDIQKLKGERRLLDW